MPGPAPKKKEARRRRNKDGVETEVVNLDEVLRGEVEVPVTPEHWDDLAVGLFESFKSSGQAIYMEPSDWMTAYSLCEILDRALKPQDVKVGERDIETQYGEDEEGEELWRKTGKDYVFEEKLIPVPGATLTAILKGLAALMATEGDRRKLRLELERQNAINAAVGAAPVIDIASTREEAFRLAAQQG